MCIIYCTHTKQYTHTQLCFCVCVELIFPLCSQQCLQCNGVNSVGSCTPAVGVPSADGAGVANTDFVLYISANQSACPPLPASGPTTVAFATHCQLEDSIDRPVAGNVNFCPEGIARNVNGLQYIAAVTKHELLHALGFSSSLFPFWHDQNGNPRTSRTENQFPTMAGTSTIERFTYPMWQTRGGKVTHTVRSLVTPTVVVGNRTMHRCVFVSLVLVPVPECWERTLWVSYSWRC